MSLFLILLLLLLLFWSPTLPTVALHVSLVPFWIKALCIYHFCMYGFSFLQGNKLSKHIRVRSCLVISKEKRKKKNKAKASKRKFVHFLCKLVEFNFEENKLVGAWCPNKIKSFIMCNKKCILLWKEKTNKQTAYVCSWLPSAEIVFSKKVFCKLCTTWHQNKINYCIFKSLYKSI